MSLADEENVSQRKFQGFDEAVVSEIVIPLLENACTCLELLAEKDVLTLRDRFAMAALTGLASSKNYDSHIGDVRLAYQYADAMLKAREQ